MELQQAMTEFGRTTDETAEILRAFNEHLSDDRTPTTPNRAERRKKARESRLRNDGSKKKVNG